MLGFFLSCFVHVLHKRHFVEEVLVILSIKNQFFLLEVVYTMYVEDVYFTSLQYTQKVMH